jgi:hypothetical protein
MLTNMRLRFLWCMLACGTLLMSIPVAASWIDQIIVSSSLNRWVHFLVYALVAAIPVAAWRQRTNQLFSLVFLMLGIAIELLPAFLRGHVVHSQNAHADLFGVGAGILLGLNLRVMRHSGNSLSDQSQNPS